jgi:hypothetical protein
MVGEYIYAKIPVINNMFSCANLYDFKVCVYYQDAFPCHKIPNGKNISSMA